MPKKKSFKTLTTARSLRCCGLRRTPPARWASSSARRDTHNGEPPVISSLTSKKEASLKGRVKNGSLN